MRQLFLTILLFCSVGIIGLPAKVLLEENFDRYPDGVRASNQGGAPDFSNFGFTKIRTYDSGDSDRGVAVVRNKALNLESKNDNEAIALNFPLGKAKNADLVISFDISYDNVRNYSALVVRLFGETPIGFQFRPNEGIVRAFDEIEGSGDREFVFEADSTYKVVIHIRGSGTERSVSLRLQDELLFDGVRLGERRPLGNFLTVQIGRFNDGADPSPIITLDNLRIETE